VKAPQQLASIPNDFDQPSPAKWLRLPYWIRLISKFLSDSLLSKLLAFRQFTAEDFSRRRSTTAAARDLTRIALDLVGQPLP